MLCKKQIGTPNILIRAHHIHTSRPSSRTLRVLTWTSLDTVAKSLVQNMKKSLKPSGQVDFSLWHDPDLCSLLWLTVSESIEGNTGSKESATIWCFGGRLNGAPTKTRISCNSGSIPILEEYVGVEGNDSTVVEHLIGKYDVIKKWWDLKIIM